MRKLYYSLIASILAGVISYFIVRGLSYTVEDSIGMALILFFGVGFIVLMISIGIEEERKKKSLKEVEASAPAIADADEEDGAGIYYDDWASKYSDMTVEDIKYMSLEELRDFLDDYLDEREAYEELMNEGKLSRSAKDAILMGIGFGLTSSALNGGHSSNSNSGS